MHKPHQDHSMYYLAVLCPSSIDEKVLSNKLWMRDRFGCTVALKSSAHITVIPPFWMKTASEELLVQTLTHFQTNISSFEIQLSGFSYFSNRVLFVAVNENPQLESLRKAVEAHFMHAFHGVIKPDDRTFHPHVTIANRDIKPGDFIKAWDHFKRLSFDEHFEANTVSLLKLSENKWNVIAEQPFASKSSGTLG